MYDNITKYLTLVDGARKGEFLVFNSMRLTDVGAYPSQTRNQSGDGLVIPPEVLMN